MTGHAASTWAEQFALEHPEEFWAAGRRRECEVFIALRHPGKWQQRWARYVTRLNVKDHRKDRR